MRVIPRTELVTVGAVATILFTLLGLVAVLLVYFLDPRGVVSARTRRGLLIVACVELAVIAVVVELEWWRYGLFASLGLLLAIFAYSPLERAADALAPTLGAPEPTTDEEKELEAERVRYKTAQARYLDAHDSWIVANEDREPPRSPAEQEAAEHAWVRAQDAWARARKRWDRLEEDLVKRADHARAAAAGQRLAKPKGRTRKLFNQARALGIPALVVIALGLVLILTSEKTRWLGYLLPIPFGLFAVLLGVARATRGFAWYGVAVFLSVPLFGGMLAIAKTRHTPEVQPLAVVRKSDDRALCGIYVTQTEDRLYVGRVELNHGSERAVQKDTGRIFSIPLDDVDVVSIGPLQRISDAQVHAQQLVKEVYAIRAEETPAEVKNKVTVVETEKPPKTTTTTEEPPKRLPPVPRPRPRLRKAECPGIDLLSANELKAKKARRAMELTP